MDRNQACLNTQVVVLSILSYIHNLLFIFMNSYFINKAYSLCTRCYLDCSFRIFKKKKKLWIIDVLICNHVLQSYLFMSFVLRPQILDLQNLCDLVWTLSKARVVNIFTIVVPKSYIYVHELVFNAHCIKTHNLSYGLIFEKQIQVRRATRFFLTARDTKNETAPQNRLFQCK